MKDIKELGLCIRGVAEVILELDHEDFRELDIVGFQGEQDLAFVWKGQLDGLNAV